MIPLQHQKLALKNIRRHRGRYGLFLAPGTGKTPTAIWYAQTKGPTLIICRRDDYLTWYDHLIELGEDDKTITQVETGSEQIVMSQWVIITYGLLRNKAILEQIKSMHFAVAIADEAQYIKHWGSAQTKATYKATRHIPRRLALTGSPITNKPVDLFSLGMFIDDGRTLGNSQWHFLKQYYIKDPAGYGWFLKRTSKDLIAKKLHDLAMYVHEDDVLNLPPIRNVTKSCPMSPQQKKHYEEVLTNWELEIKDGVRQEIDHVIVQLAKLKQIASGFYYYYDGCSECGGMGYVIENPCPKCKGNGRGDRYAQYLPCTKLDLLQRVIAEDLTNKPKIVIWASYTAEIERIALLLTSLKQKHVILSGGKNKDRVRARVQFRDDNATRFFIGQVDSGVGMNELICADTAIYFSNSFKVVSKQQSLRRTRRKGSEIHERITYYELITEKTVDRRIAKGITGAMDLASYILKRIQAGHGVREILH